MAEQTSSRSNPTLFLGLIIAVAVAMLMFVFATSLQGKDKVYVAKENIPAYSQLVPGDNIVLEDVPEDSVTDNDLTKDDVEKSKERLISRLELLQGNRVDRRASSASTTGTLGVVKQGREKVITLEASYKGIVAGIVGPGAVVDIFNGEPSSEADAAIATDIKVLGVGQGSSASRNIRSGTGGNVETKGNDATVFVVVAVPSEQAGALAALTSVSLAIDPYKAFDRAGNICEISSCQNQASSTAGDPAEEQPAEEEQPTTGTDPEAVDPTDEGATQDTPTPTSGN